MTLKTGRLPRLYDPRVPHMSALLAGWKPPTPPASQRWALGLETDLGMMLNDQLGDCTCAAYYHALQLWSYHCNPDGLTITEPDADVQSLYEEVGGYVPGNPATDQGCAEQAVLAYLFNQGAPTTGPNGAGVHKLAAFVEIDPRQVDDIKWAIVDCGVVYIGFAVPNWLMSGDGPPTVWDVQPNADNSAPDGHAVILTGYDDATGLIDLISWGQHYAMTWPFFAQFVDEAYGLVDVDWINKQRTTPGGLSLVTLESQMRALRMPASAPAKP